MARLLSADPITRTRQDFHWDVHDESVVVHTQQDVTKIVEYTKAIRNMTDERARFGEGYSAAASIPTIVWEDLVRKGIAYDDKALSRWLDDEGKIWKVTPRKLSR